MEKNHFITKLNKLLPGAVLEVRRFGRSQQPSIWVGSQSILKVAKAIKEDEDFRLDWLENLSVVEFEKALVVTYFVRSTESSESVVIRVSLVPESSNATVSTLSVNEVWPMAAPMEAEAAEMFGVRFLAHSKDTQDEQGFAHMKLPENWVGFPMRKDYQFPNEFLGMKHKQNRQELEVGHETEH